MSRMVMCPCGRVLKLGPEQVGRVTACPRCGHLIDPNQASAGNPKPVAPPRAAAPSAVTPSPAQQLWPQQPQPPRAQPPRVQPQTVRPIVPPPAGRPAPIHVASVAPPLSGNPSPVVPSPSPLFQRPSGSHPCAPVPPPSPPTRGRSIPWPLVGAVGGGAVLGALLLIGMLSLASRNRTPAAPGTNATGSVVQVTAPSTPLSAPSSSPMAAGPKTTREIVSRNETSVAKIEGKLGKGTGFVVAPGIVATNAHVISEELVSNLSSRFPSAAGRDQGPFPVHLLYVNPPRDLALLKVDCPQSPVEVARSYTFQRGEEITIIGNPGGLGGSVSLENAITRGVLSTEATFRGQRWYQLGASVNPGNSGGPVFDSLGRVVGIITLKAIREEGHSYCIPVDALTTALDEVSDITTAQRLKVERRHNTRSIASFLYNGAKTYWMTSILLISAYEAADQKTPDADEMRSRFHAAKEGASRFHGRLGSDYASALEVVLGDDGTDPSVRRDLTELKRVLDQVKVMAEQPDGRVDAYKQDLLKARDVINRLGGHLSTELDVDVEPL